MGSISLSTEAATNLVTLQLPRIQEEINEAAARRSPWLNVLEGGTVDLINEDNSYTSTVFEHAVPPGSYIEPVFVDSDSAFSIPDEDLTGQTQFTTKLQTYYGRSASVDVKKAVHYLKNSLGSAERALQRLIVDLKNNDIRINLYNKSGVKYVAQVGDGSENVTGGYNVVSAPFLSEYPTGRISFTTLTNLMDYMHETLEVEKFGDGMNGHFVFLGGQSIVNTMRNEGLISSITTALTQGGVTEGENRFKTYMFTDFQNQGIRMGVDQFPLRYNYLKADGSPLLIESHEQVATDDGYAHRVSNAWRNATYEIGFLIGKGSFKYRVPVSWNGESKWKWAPQMTSGELQFINQRDNSTNMFQRYGYFIYQIDRLIETCIPHAIMPIAFRRANSDFGVEEVTTSFS